MRRRRVLFSLAEPTREQRKPTGKGEVWGKKNLQLGQLWSLAIVSDVPRTIKIRRLFDVRWPVLAGSPAPCRWSPTPPSWGSGPTPWSTLSSQVSFCPRDPSHSLVLPRAHRAWGRHSPTPPRPLFPGLLTPLLIAVLTCRIDWRPRRKRLRRPWPRSSLGGGQREEGEVLDMGPELLSQPAWDTAVCPDTLLHPLTTHVSSTHPHNTLTPSPHQEMFSPQGDPSKILLD